jgi:uncharacterized protein YcbX
MSSAKVVSIWRYPVKSMQGEEVEKAELTDRGLAGDRAYAILDRETGFVASAKLPQKWGVLLHCRATYLDEPVADRPLPPLAITLPDGSRIDSSHADIDRVLSSLLHREVSLVTQAPEAARREADRTPVDDEVSPAVIRNEAIAAAAPKGTFFDYGVLHLLTTSTLATLAQLHADAAIDIRRFRPNLLIRPEGDDAGFVENDWLNRELHVGPAVRLKVFDPCPRCVVITLAQEGLARDVALLRTVARHNTAASATLAPGRMLPAVAGVYAQPGTHGFIRQGDPVKVV